MEALAGEQNTCRANAVRGKSDSEEWFTHSSSPAERHFHFRPRVRPEAIEIVGKNRRAAGSMGQMAGFVDDPLPSGGTKSISRRLRSQEANNIAQGMTRSTDNWSDFEGNLVASSANQPTLRVGSSLEAEEIIKLQTRKCDWFVDNTQNPESTKSKATRPSTALERTLNYDWLAHGYADQSATAVRSVSSRVRGEGEEYARRNRGSINLLKTAPPEVPPPLLYHCPSKESQHYCRQNTESNSVAECLKTCNLTGESKKDQSSATMRPTGSTSSTILCHDNPVTLRTPKKKVPAARTVHNITPPLQRPHVSKEARHTYQKNRDGQMGSIIGKDADSTIMIYPSKNQAKAVNSEEAISNQKKACGNAIRALITHSNLADAPPRRQAHRLSDQLKLVLSDFDPKQQLQLLPPRRLVSAEARCYADRQRGTMGDLLTYG